MKTILAVAVATSAIALAFPASAHDKKHWTGPVYDDSNSHYLDYKTDLSEARRELRKDLRRANDEGDRIDAWDEYHREVADAKHDFAKEMAERGVNVTRRPTVRVI
jgi:hypothetical protein